MIQEQELVEVTQAATRSKPCPLCDARPHHGLGKVEHCQLHGEPFQRFSIWCPAGHAKVTAANEEIARRLWDERPGERAARNAVIEECAAKLDARAEEFADPHGDGAAITRADARLVRTLSDKGEKGS